jgi:hypothetical protein
LNHLVVSTGPLVHKSIAEDDSTIVNYLSAFKAAEVFKSTGRWNQVGGGY